MLAIGCRTIKWIIYLPVGIFRCQTCESFLISLLLLTLLLARSIPAAETKGIESASTDSKSQQMEENIQVKTTSKVRADQASPTFKVNVDLASTSVRVIGQYPSELHAEDFIIYDNDVPHEVVFCSYDELPVAIALLIDRSGSVKYTFVNLKLAALLSLKTLKPEDQVALFSFTTGATKNNDLTVDRLLIAEKINKIEPNENLTYGFKALYNTARYLHKNANNRRCAIFLISDNALFDTQEYERARTEILRSGASLFSIQTPFQYPQISKVVDPYQIKMTIDHVNQKLKEIVNITGGDFLEVDSKTSMQKALEKAVTNFRYQYTLGFYPSDLGEKGSYHKLDVKFKTQDRCPGCQIITRSGYYTGSISLSPMIPPSIPKTIVDGINKTLIQRIILTAGSYELDVQDIPFTIIASDHFILNGQPQLNVSLNIDPTEIEFRKEEGRFLYNLQISIIYADNKGKLLVADWKEFKGELLESDYERTMNEGLLYKTTIPNKTNKQTVKVVVYDELSNRIGSRFLNNWDKEK